MENITIRLPYEGDALDGNIYDAKRTDLSIFLDKEREFDELKDPTIMLIPTNSRMWKIYNASYNKSVTPNVGYFKTNYNYLLPIIKLSEKDFERLSKISEGGTVEFGYFPSTLVNDEYEDEILRHSKRKLTGNSYTLPVSRNYEDRKKVKSDGCMVNLKSFPEYEIAGEKYIVYKESKKSKTYFFKVEPLRWYLDSKNNELICESLPVNGIVYNDYSTLLYVPYKESFVYKYLDENFLKEAILSHIKQEEKLPEKIDEATTLLNEIAVYAEYYRGTEDIDEIINEIIRKYNEELERLKTKSGLILCTEEGLYLQMLSNLNILLDKLKKGSESSKEYCDMLKLIESSIDILNGKKLEEIDNELLKDIETIVTEILPRLTSVPERQEEIKQRLLKELTSDRDKINSYLEYINVLSKDITLSTHRSIEFKTPKEYELNFRIRLQSILERLLQMSLEEERQVLINKKNEVLRELESKNASIDEINYELYKILESHYRNDSNGNNVINILLKEVNNLVRKLRSYDIKPEPAFDVDLPNSDLNEIVKSLDAIIINLYKMVANAELNQKKLLRIDSYKISI